MQKAIVLHSDILGFKEIIELAQAEKDEATLNSLKNTLKYLLGYANAKSF